ncbi:hypothetical protein thsps21_20270 [Pseudomonas sp. No.21]|nr:hypothetical protein TUM20249_41190 [Pseudomonas tohonis]
MDDALFIHQEILQQAPAPASWERIRSRCNTRRLAALCRLQIFRGSSRSHRESPPQDRTWLCWASLRSAPTYGTAPNPNPSANRRVGWMAPFPSTSGVAGEHERWTGETGSTLRCD